MYFITNVITKCHVQQLTSLLLTSPHTLKMYMFKHPDINIMLQFFYQSPGVQASASLALAVMSENLSSRDVIGKLGKNQ